MKVFLLFSIQFVHYIEEKTETENTWCCDFASWKLVGNILSHRKTYPVDEQLIIFENPHMAKNKLQFQNKVGQVYLDKLNRSFSKEKEADGRIMGR